MLAHGMRSLISLNLPSPFVAGGPPRPSPKSSIIDIGPPRLVGAGVGTEVPKPRLFSKSIELFIPSKTEIARHAYLNSKIDMCNN